VPENRWFNPSCFEVLQSVVGATDAQIVVSSSWRRHPFLLKRLRKELKAYGLTAPKVTPSFERDHFDSEEERRAAEICTWLMKNPEVSSYVALDDLPLGLGRHPAAKQIAESCILVNSMTGLTESDGRAAVRALQY